MHCRKLNLYLMLYNWKSCNIVNHVHTANTEALTKGVKYMINIAEMIQSENKNGYVQTDQASAKVAQDLILVAISGSSVNKNIAIKGGVVMMNKTQNVRRATRDIDLSFIHYSLSDESINDFVSQLHIPGIKFQRVGKIEELHQQDYHGKRIYVLITDMFGNSLKTKMDIGVHNRLNIEQDECSFNAVIDNQRQEFKILVNSNEQIFAEKLRSLIKFKTVSTRFKDIADLYYLSDKVNTAKLRECVDTYILSDTELPQYNNVDDILKVLNVIASNKKYKKRVISSKQLWIDDDIDEMFSVIIHALEKI